MIENMENTKTLSDSFGCWKYKRLFTEEGSPSDHFAVINNNNHPEKIISVVSDKFFPIEHSKAVEQVQDLLVTRLGNPLTTKTKLDKLDTYMEHSIIYNEPISISPLIWEKNTTLYPPILNSSIDVDKVLPVITIINSLAGHASYQVVLEFYREVCSNGIPMGRVLGIAPLMIQHSKTAIEKSMDRIIETFDVMLEKLQKKASYKELEKELTTEQTKVILKDIPKKYLEEFANSMNISLGESLTAWQLINLITFITTHRVRAQRGRALATQAFTRMREFI